MACEAASDSKSSVSADHLSQPSIAELQLEAMEPAATTRLLRDGDSFFESCSELLLRDLAKNQVLFGYLTKGCLEVLASPGALPTQSKPEEGQLRQLFSFHGQETSALGVLMLGPGPPSSGRPSLFAAGHLEESWVTEALSMVHPRLVRLIGTVYGPAEVVEAVALALQKLRPAVSWTPGLRVTAMELVVSQGTVKSLPAGHMVRVLPVRDEPVSEGLCDEVLLADEAILEKLTDCHLGFKQDVGILQDQETREQLRQATEALVATCEVYVWQVEREVAALLAAGRALADVGRSITMVYTAPEHRRRGYAGALVDQVGRALADRGKRTCLNADATGTNGALRLYESLGFTNQGLMQQLFFADQETEPSALS